MNKRLKLLGIFITATLYCHAQTKKFDPSLDTNVAILKKQSQKEWSGHLCTGQQTASYQRQCVWILKERCINVGYLTNLFAKNNHVWYKKKVKLEKGSCSR